jgi:hypothetical protein
MLIDFLIAGSNNSLIVSNFAGDIFPPIFMLEAFTSLFRRSCKKAAVVNFYRDLFHRVPIEWFSKFYDLPIDQIPSDSYVHLVFDSPQQDDIAECFGFDWTMKEKNCVRAGLHGWHAIPEAEIFGRQFDHFVVLAIDELSDETFDRWQRLLDLLVDRFDCENCRKEYRRMT